MEGCGKLFHAFEDSCRNLEIMEKVNSKKIDSKKIIVQFFVKKFLPHAFSLLHESPGGVTDTASESSLWLVFL